MEMCVGAVTVTVSVTHCPAEVWRLSWSVSAAGAEFLPSGSPGFKHSNGGRPGDRENEEVREVPRGRG